MKRISGFTFGVLALSLFLLLPALFAQAEEPVSGLPPIGQQMVREGDFAVKLLEALSLGSAEDEVDAETQLGNLGIAPRNGWIADYPVTPDIIGELHKSLRDAADSDRIDMDGDQAVKILEQVNAEAGVAIMPSTIAPSGSSNTPRGSSYPDQTVINNYYSTEGPPVVTYYAPPADYYPLYSWVPYPFWGFGFWFPGYFILNDFNRVVHSHNRVFIVSNHFRDVRNHRVYRVDPVVRYRGRTYAGIGVANTRGFISTGVRKGERSIFNSPRMRMTPATRSVPPSSRGGGARINGGSRIEGGGRSGGGRNSGGSRIDSGGRSGGGVRGGSQERGRR
jgi:hypothetical protein